MESVFSELYERHIDTVYRICYAMMGNRQDAEDAAQSVFVKLMRSKMTFQSVEHEKAWLIATARNHCRDEHRRWWRKKVVKFETGMPDEQHADRLPQHEMMDGMRRLPSDFCYLYSSGYTIHRPIIQAGN